MTRIRQLRRFNIVLVLILALSFYRPSPVAAADDSQYFPETRKTISGKFLQYWRANGGLATYGYPITDAQNEVDPETNKTYLTQWFERNRFELHPENARTKYEVLLGLLGKDLRREALVVDPDFQRAEPLNLINGHYHYFEETGHNLASDFFLYWQNNGGLARFGFPISEAHEEVDPETGKVFFTQWFERARFEYHPENNAPYDVLLGLLGNQIKNPKAKIEFVAKRVAGFKNPEGIAVNARGDIYVTDSGTNQVIKFACCGNAISKWGGSGTGNGQFNGPFGIALDSQGNVYVADKGNARIQKFDPNGKFLGKWGSKGSGKGQFDSPVGITVDLHDQIYVADTFNHRIQVFDGTGNFLGRLGEYGDQPGEFFRPLDVAVNNHGDIYVVEGHNARVQKFNASGEYLTGWAVGAGDSPYTGALALDSQGNVYVADYRSSLIQKFDPNGKLLGQFGSEGEADGQLFLPTGLAVDGQNDLYVANYDLPYIQKFRQR